MLTRVLRYRRFRNRNLRQRNQSLGGTMEPARSRYERDSVQRYAREVRSHLPLDVFEPVPGRLLWLPVHLAVIAAASTVVVVAAPPWRVALACALAAGHSRGCPGIPPPAA